MINQPASRYECPIGKLLSALEAIAEKWVFHFELRLVVYAQRISAQHMDGYQSRKAQLQSYLSLVGSSLSIKESKGEVEKERIIEPHRKWLGSSGRFWVTWFGAPSWLSWYLVPYG